MLEPSNSDRNDMNELLESTMGNLTKVSELNESSSDIDSPIINEGAKLTSIQKTNPNKFKTARAIGKNILRDKKDTQIEILVNDDRA